MNVLILGATGMVGQGVLRECLRDDGVQRVVTLGRTRRDSAPEAARDRPRRSASSLAQSKDQTARSRRVLLLLGASAPGSSRRSTRGINYEITLAVAETLVRLDPT
jgi:nucleoside-diphosphate-sugar epimerase